MKRLAFLGLLLGGSVFGSVNYYEDVKPIVESKCQLCHAESSVSFSFEVPEQTVAYGPAMVNAVITRRMPPWLAAKGHREYLDDYSLSEDEIQTFQSWADNSYAIGEKAKEKVGRKKKNLTFSYDKTLVVNGGEAYLPRQDRKDDYRCFIMDWPLNEDIYVTGFEGRPGNLKVAHHLVLYSAPPELAPIIKELAREEEGPGYQCFGGGFPDRIGKPKVAKALENKYPGIIQKINDGVHWVAHWAPGMGGYEFAKGSGVPIKPGAIMIAQMHYFSAFAPGEKDQNTEARFKLAKQVKHAGFNIPLTRKEWLNAKKNRSMLIPAGAERSYKISEPMQVFADRAAAYLKVPAKQIKSLELHSANLHMHEIGKSGRIYMEDEWGQVDTLLEIPRWDLNWQRDFAFKESIKIKSEDFMKKRLTVECTFLNPKDELVFGGFGSEEEMCFNFSYFVVELDGKIAKRIVPTDRF